MLNKIKLGVWGRSLTEHYQTRNLQGCWTSFLLTIYCWAHSLHLRVVCLPSETPLDKTKVAFPSGYQLETASGLGIRTCVHFFQLVQTFASPVHAASVSLSS